MLAVASLLHAAGDERVQPSTVIVLTMFVYLFADWWSELECSTRLVSASSFTSGQEHRAGVGYLRQTLRYGYGPRSPEYCR